MALTTKERPIILCIMRIHFVRVRKPHSHMLTSSILSSEHLVRHQMGPYQIFWSETKHILVQVTSRMFSILPKSRFGPTWESFTGDAILKKRARQETAGCRPNSCSQQSTSFNNTMCGLPKRTMQKGAEPYLTIRMHQSWYLSAYKEKS